MGNTKLPGSNPSLVVVMAGALATFVVLNRVNRLRGAGAAGAAGAAGTVDAGAGGADIPGATPKSRISRATLVGAAVFGVGWGLAGLCPGPALANLGAWRFEALVFVPAMVAGMWVAQRFAKADR